MTDDVTWDDQPAAPSAQDIAWDDETNSTRAKAADLVHAGQSSYFPDMATTAGKELALLARKGVNAFRQLPPYSLLPDASDSNPVRQFSSDAAIKAAEGDAAPDFQKSPLTKIALDTAATLPIGGPIEGSLAKFGTSALGGSVGLIRRLMGSRAVGAGTSGAVTSGLTADPGERGIASLEGGALGGVTGAASDAGGALSKGLVTKSQPLLRMEGDVAATNALPGAPKRDLFVPVSQGYDPDSVLSSTIGKFYKSALPYSPGVETMLTNQSKAAARTYSEAMLQEGAPDGTIIPKGVDMQAAVRDVKDVYANDIFGKLRQVNNIAIPKDFAADLKSRIQTADPQIPASDVDNHVAAVEADLQHQAENSKDGRINAWNLKNAKDNVYTLNPDMPAEQKSAMVGETKGMMDDMFEAKLKQAFNLGHQNTQDIIEAYRGNRDNYENFRPLMQASEANARGMGVIQPGKVAMRANPDTLAQRMDQDNFAVLGQKPAQVSQPGRLAGYSAVAGANAVTGGAHLPAVSLIMGGAGGLATKAVQKTLYGDSVLQKLIQDNPGRSSALALTLRKLAEQSGQFGDADGPQ